MDHPPHYSRLLTTLPGKATLPLIFSIHPSIHPMTTPVLANEPRFLACGPRSVCAPAHTMPCESKGVPQRKIATHTHHTKLTHHDAHRQDTLHAWLCGWDGKIPPLGKKPNSQAKVWLFLRAGREIDICPHSIRCIFGPTAA